MTWWQREGAGSLDTLRKWWCHLQVGFVTVPPNFQHPNEKRWAANQRFCSMKFSVTKNPRWLNKVFLFSTETWAEQLKNHPVPLVYCKKNFCWIFCFAHLCWYWLPVHWFRTIELVHHHQVFPNLDVSRWKPTKCHIIFQQSCKLKLALMLACFYLKTSSLNITALLPLLLLEDPLAMEQDLKHFKISSIQSWFMAYHF